MKILKYLIKISFPPILLILVWIYNIRPTNYLDFIVNRIQNNPKFPLTILGAIDVAILTVISNILTDLFLKIFNHFATINISFKGDIDKSIATVKFDPDAIENTEATVVKVTIEGNINKTIYYKLFKYVFKNIGVKIIWHPTWLSATIENDYGKKDCFKLLGKGPGYYSFDILNYFSESDPEINIPLKLHILANDSIKNSGNIKAKIILSDNKFLNFFFSWILNLLIKTDLKSLKIYIKTGE